MAVTVAKPAALGRHCSRDGQTDRYATPRHAIRLACVSLFARAASLCRLTSCASSSPVSPPASQEVVVSGAPATQRLPRASARRGVEGEGAGARRSRRGKFETCANSLINIQDVVGRPSGCCGAPFDADYYMTVVHIPAAACCSHTHYARPRSLVRARATSPGPPPPSSNPLAPTPPLKRALQGNPSRH